jgi:hypothetical protein
MTEMYRGVIANEVKQSHPLKKIASFLAMTEMYRGVQ